MRYIHARVEEKFKGFRQAFRTFDKNFGGTLDFKEFITGMESIGVKLKLEDYKMVFEALDYDNDGELDFKKFCYLNQDRKVDLNKLVKIPKYFYLFFCRKMKTYKRHLNATKV
jgi:hypothetical protein